MGRIALTLAALALCTQALAATAFFTGRQEQVQTVTYQMGWRCWYNYNGQIFSRVFVGTCPMSVEVQ